MSSNTEIITCPSCNSKARIPSSKMNSKVRCKQCHQIFRIASSDSPENSPKRTAPQQLESTGATDSTPSGTHQKQSPPKGKKWVNPLSAICVLLTLLIIVVAMRPYDLLRRSAATLQTEKTEVSLDKTVPERSSSSIPQEEKPPIHPLGSVVVKNTPTPQGQEATATHQHSNKTASSPQISKNGDSPPAHESDRIKGHKLFLKTTAALTERLNTQRSNEINAFQKDKADSITTALNKLYSLLSTRAGKFRNVATLSKADVSEYRGRSLERQYDELQREGEIAYSRLINTYSIYVSTSEFDKLSAIECAGLLSLLDQERPSYEYEYNKKPKTYGWHLLVVLGYLPEWYFAE